MVVRGAQVLPQYSVRRVALPSSAVAPPQAAPAPRASGDVSSRSTSAMASAAGEQELCVADALFATCSADCTMRVWRLSPSAASDALSSPLSSSVPPFTAYPAPSTSCVWMRCACGSYDASYSSLKGGRVEGVGGSSKCGVMSSSQINLNPSHFWIL